MFGRFSFALKALLVATLTFTFVAMAVSPALPGVLGDRGPLEELQGLPVISWLIANVSAQRIYHLLYDFQNFSTRYVYTPNANDSAEYIVRDFSNSSGLIVQSQYFLWNNLLLRNVIAIIPTFNPANKTAYVIGGHYDSWSVNNPMVWAPGVDDDGSGTAATMEVARVLSPYKFNSTLIFGAWTAEEVGLVGSEYYAADARNNGLQVGAMIQMDMIGNYATQMGLNLVHDGYSEWIADALITANTDYGIGLGLTKSFNTAGNSDHASFWSQGYDAIMAAEMDFSPHWHQDTDTIDNVNIDLITNATRLVAAAAAELAGIIPPGVGAVSLDKEVYKPGDFANIYLYDTDLDLNPSIPDTATVTMFSDSEPTGELVLMNEMGVDTGLFSGSIEMNVGTPASGKLEVSHDDQVRVEYIEADPPGVKTAWARVDAVSPRIWDVHAIPDVDTALIIWSTNEASDSTVFYGETKSLGLQADVASLVTSHSVLLTGLSPGTRYYYDVQSADAAGNYLREDNGGSHYTFMTLTGSVGRPDYGYVGYVKSNDPMGNYFTGPEIIVGQGVQGTYLGAAQLNTTAGPIPPGATILKASFEALGMGWIYQSIGQWSIRVLNASIDAGWTTKGYTAINGASIDTTLLPTLTEADVEADKWNVFDFQQNQFDYLRNRVNTGTISFRFDGPRSGRVIFTWHTGNMMRSGGVSPVAPLLRIIYSMRGDTIGPVVSTLFANPNPTMSTTSTDINITISDVGTGGGNVTYAEYFWGPDPGIGKATPLLAADGGFDSPTENAALGVDVSTMPRGVYSLGVRGRDDADNWGPTRVLDLYVGVWDLYPPVLDSLTFVPTQPESDFPTNISARVTDDIAVYGAWASITDPSGNPRGNFSMSFDPVQQRYFVPVAFHPLGLYTATLWANDTSNRWGTISGTFEVVDTTAPTIIQIAATPPIQDYGLTVTFTAWVVDSFIDTVHLIIRDPSGMQTGNYTAIRLGPPGDNYTYMLTFPTLGQWSYCFAARDTSGNWATACDVFMIKDGFPPTIISTSATPPQQVYGQPVTITAWAVDPYINSVHANISKISGGWIGNFSMTRVAPFSDNWTLVRQFSGIGQYSYIVWAVDDAGNVASAFSGFSIIDRTPPVFDNVVVTPNPAEVFTQVSVAAQVTDVQTVTVHIEIWSPSGGQMGNFTMTYNQTNGLHEHSVQGDLLGRYTFSLWAVDPSNNGARRQGDFVVRDTTRPVITLLDKLANLFEVHNTVNVTVRITDNIGLRQDGLTLEWKSPTGTTITNQSLSAMGGSDYYFTYELQVQGSNSFIVTAFDTSNNAAVLNGVVDVVLGQPPVADAGQDRETLVGSELTLDGTASTDDFGIVLYLWDIEGPDGIDLLDGPTVSYKFTSVGTYTVTLAVYDAADNENTTTITVIVKAPVTPEQVGIDPIVVMLLVLTVIIAVVVILFIASQRNKDAEDVTEEEEEKEAAEDDTED